MKKINKFTLIEVIVAVAVLAVGLMSAMMLCSLSKSRMDKAYNSWKIENVTSQAAEYYLLAGPGTSIPENIFPYDDITTSCTIGQPEMLPSDIKQQNGQWSLVNYDIQVRKNNGDLLKELKIDKIINNANQM